MRTIGIVITALIIAFTLILLSCKKDNGIYKPCELEKESKINGVSFVSPSDSFPEQYMTYTDKVAANWIAVSPFAFSSTQTTPEVVFNVNQQWWGEKPQGVKTIITYAQNKGLKIMLKPQVWIPNGWVGNYDLQTEEEWQKWENDYQKFIIQYAEIANEKNVDIFCIGTEYRIAVEKRAQFWNELIDSVKTIYQGKLTYAANWDDYEQTSFWERLDYIGVDSYFPLVEEKTPSVEDLTKAWQAVKDKLSSFSCEKEKKILFTEYGYMSVDYTAWQNWENEKIRDELSVNFIAQENAFEALFQSIWQEDWMAGGFIWKWYDDYNKVEGEFYNKDYTPQRKNVEVVIKRWYETP